MLAVTKNRTKSVGGWQGSCVVCVDLQAVGALEFFGELYSLAIGFGPFLRGFGQALEKGRVLFLVTASISPSVQAYAELHALSPPSAGRYALGNAQLVGPIGNGPACTNHASKSVLSSSSSKICLSDNEECQTLPH